MGNMRHLCLHISLIRRMNPPILGLKKEVKHMSAHPLQMFKFRIRFSLVQLLNKMGFSPEVHYIGSNEVLPPPLSAEEEKELLVRLQDGDLKVRTPLIERNLRLVVYIARKF